MMRWRGTAESVAYGAFSMRNGAVTVSNTAGLLSASIRSLMTNSQAGVLETAERTPPSYRLRALIYIDGKNSLRLRAYDESGSQNFLSQSQINKSSGLLNEDSAEGDR